AVSAVSYSANGKALAAADHDGNTYFWDTNGDRSPRVLRQPQSVVTGVVLSGKGKLVITSARDEAKNEGTLTLWDVEKGKPLKSSPAPPGGVNCLTLSSDGRTLASGGADRRVKVWQLDEDKAVLEQKHTLEGHLGAVRCVAFSPDGAWLASGGE